MAVLQAARQAVTAINQALTMEAATTALSAAPASSGSDAANVVESAESAKSQGDQPVGTEISTEEKAELEAALNRDQVLELLAPLGKDADESVASTSRAALAAWQEASRKKIIIGRGTRQASASLAGGALQRAAHRVSVERSVVRSFGSPGGVSSDAPG